MEWMLQVVDEFDDAFGVFRHGCLGVTAEVGMLVGGTREFLSSIGTALKDSVQRRRTRP